ncbi:uncharacterized protein SOCE26_079910 [Sorangium cellulosum]|uniref:Uncharacterized protein n=2 Tax=Sorangium cellulosum TaxID=56 RepID=A0A2L0F4J1_SORCE|nr:uncharacterized protein SOCE26_079910 [Sorangium cellulosum]
MPRAGAPPSPCLLLDEVECAGEGISARCAPCVEQAGMDQCKAELEACSGS